MALREEKARDEAQRADECCDIVLPLHGVPITVKDSLDVSGLPTSAGNASRARLKVAHDAVAVARLRAAGAIILGKTNTPEFVANYETDNFVIGRTNNPWDPERTPGGSSGGEAAAIAAFCSAGGIATDGGGSIRVPAHFCGIAGLKPTPGRVPVRGNFPAIGTPGGFITNLGPMARTIGDLALLFNILAGFDPGDPFSAPVDVTSPRAADVRIGCWPSVYGAPVEPEISAAVRRAADLLGAEPFEPAGIEAAPNVWAFLFSALPAAAWNSQIGNRIAELHWTAAETIGKAMEAPPPTTESILKTFAARDRMRAKLLRQMDEVGVLIAPVCGITAFHHRTRRFSGDRPFGLFQAMLPSVIWNALGFPALAVPMALTPQGLPVGIQLIGRPWEEQTLLAIGLRLEDRRGPFPSPKL